MKPPYSLEESLTEPLTMHTSDEAQAEQALSKPKGPASLESLLNHGQLWRGKGQHTQGFHSTSFSELDQVLPHGGWPQDAIIELISAAPGLGDMALVLPELARLSQQEGVVACIAPPWLLHGPMLEESGVCLERLLCVPSSLALTKENAKKSKQEPLQSQQWAAEQIIKSGGCNGLLYWQAKPLPFIHYRRLQMLCGQFHCPVFMFHQSAPLNSPSSVRLKIVARAEKHLHIQVLKVRGAWGQQMLNINVQNQPYHRYQLAKANSH
ncbi:MAG: hypothetical protein V7785_06975 [Bermanella sp.]